MNAKTPIIILALASLVAGCASTESKDASVWFQEGKTPEQVEQDLADCRFRSASSATGFQGKNAAWYYATKADNENSMVADCMRAKGYTRRKK